MADALERVHREARAAWPGVDLDRDAFAAYLTERIAPPISDEKLAAAHTADLYLACACLRGDRLALEAFERAFSDLLEHSLSHFNLSRAERDDVVQTLRVDLFIRKTLAGFSGRGALRSWVRSAVTRLALRLVARRKKRPDDEDDILGALPATGDPELDLVRSRFAAEFRAAFEETLRSMAPEDRLLLKQHYIDDLTIDELAQVLRVHRATAARRIVRLRAALLEGTKERLERNLRIDDAAVASLMRLAASRLEVSVFRLLAD